MGDLPLWIELSIKSKIKYLNDCTAVYRVLSESASHFTNIENEISFHKGALRIRLFYINKYQLTKLRKLTIKTFYSGVVKLAYEKNNLYYSNMYIRKLFKIGLPSLKTILFYLGTNYKIFNNFIHFIYNKKNIKHV